jgi:hypothetical protein
MLSQKISSSYLVGMIGFNDFFELLFDAIQRACPGILLSNTAAFGWRGFRIDHYRELASNQYFCHVHTDNPKILRFEEVYNDGRYRYPWNEFPQLDLELNGFFNLPRNDQRNLLVEFIFLAMEHALQWQESSERKNRVNSSYFHGHEAPSNPSPMRVIFNKIPIEFIQSTPTQNQIFIALQEIIHTEILNRLNREVILEVNTNWFNWEFRGLRMKICDELGLKPPGPTPYLWRIYYRKPAVICFKMENRSHEMSLGEGGFFSLSIEQQYECFILFVRQALDLISPNPVEIIF